MKRYRVTCFDGDGLLIGQLETVAPNTLIAAQYAAILFYGTEEIVVEEIIW